MVAGNEPLTKINNLDADKIILTTIVNSFIGNDLNAPPQPM